MGRGVAGPHIGERSLHSCRTLRALFSSQACIGVTVATGCIHTKQSMW
jgi:hypothetical protein